MDHVDEQVWTVAWWRSGWGVWLGEDPDFTRPPTYTTVNITHAAADAASHWAVGVVPSHPRLRVRCPYGGDPDGETAFRARAARRRWWRP
ncbi:hypothetical protein [Sinosporangium album]|uniref:hypothetical protein n=1 Tax=Sinosporangium album TaxID=504805 RepID=UPI00115F8D71|nr:hypothetical protein [Sinosporangium album]